MGSFRKTSQKQIFKKTEGELNVKKFKGLIEKKKLSLKTQTSLDLDKIDKLGEFSAEMLVKRSFFQEIWLKRIRSSFRPLSITQKGKLSEKAQLDFDAIWVFAIEGKSFEQLDVSGIFEAQKCYFVVFFKNGKASITLWRGNDQGQGLVDLNSAISQFASTKFRNVSNAQAKVDARSASVLHTSTSNTLSLGSLKSD